MIASFFCGFPVSLLSITRDVYDAGAICGNTNTACNNAIRVTGREKPQNTFNPSFGDTGFCDATP